MPTDFRLGVCGPGVSHASSRNGIQMLNENTGMEAFLDIADLYGEGGIHVDFKLFGEAIERAFL